MINEKFINELTNLLKSKGKEGQLIKLFLFVFCFASISIKFLALIDNERMQTNMNLNYCSIYCKNDGQMLKNEKLNTLKFESNLVKCLDLCSVNSDQYNDEISKNQLKEYKLDLLNNAFNINSVSIVLTIVLFSLFFIFSNNLLDFKYKVQFSKDEYENVDRLYEALNDNENENFNLTSKLIS